MQIERNAIKNMTKEFPEIKLWSVKFKWAI